MKELWKKIDGFEHYEVSNFGRVRSIRREFKRVHPRWKTSIQTVAVGGGIINGWTRYRNGDKPLCVFVSIREKGKTHTFRVHRLVLEAFVGECPEGMEGCHNDGDPTNNHINNLRWDTHQANVSDMEKHGRSIDPPIHIGSSHPNSKLTEKDIVEIRSQEYKVGLYTEISKKYGISIAHASRIHKMNGWDHVLQTKTNVNKTRGVKT